MSDDPMRQELRVHLLDGIRDILNKSLPGTAGPGTREEGDDDESLLERLRDILGAPLPGTKGWGERAPAGPGPAPAPSASDPQVAPPGEPGREVHEDEREGGDDRDDHGEEEGVRRAWQEMKARHHQEREELQRRHEREREDLKRQRERSREDAKRAREQARRDRGHDRDRD